MKAVITGNAPQSKDEQMYDDGLILIYYRRSEWDLRKLPVYGEI